MKFTNTIKLFLFTLFVAAICGQLCSCSSYTANLSTTVDSPVATVDNPTGIVSGMTVTAPNVPSGESVKSILGENVTLALNAIQSSTASAKFSPTAITIAQKFSTNTKAYAQTLGNMLQIGLKDVASTAPTLAALTSFASSLAQSWGMAPVNSDQQATFTSVLATINKVGSNAGAISTFLTGLQTTGSTSTAYDEPNVPAPGEMDREIAMENMIHPLPIYCVLNGNN